jgi:hypothetical protein
MLPGSHTRNDQMPIDFMPDRLRWDDSFGVEA